MAKKRRTASGSHVSDSDIPWVSLPLGSHAESVNETTDDGFAGWEDVGGDFLGLQAVDGIDVVYEKNPSGFNRVRFVKTDKAPKKKAVAETAAKKQKPAAKARKAKKEQEQKSVDDVEDSRDSEDDAADDSDAAVDSSASKVNAKRSSKAADFAEADAALAGIFSAAQAAGIADEDFDAELPEWEAPLHARLRHALSELGFTTPTHIQRETLPLALGVDGAPRDVVGIAQTGSGKTLAYGLPILEHVLSAGLDESNDATRPLEALVLAPTRELALQVAQHLRAVSNAGGHIARIAAVCGGMSEQKQRRVLEQHGGAHIIVATPGRLWDLLKHNDALVSRVRRTRFLVLDEADRMVDAGHFAELDLILRIVRRTVGAAVDANPEMQTFIYSATLSKALQENLARKQKLHKRKRTTDDKSTLDDLVARIDFRDAQPALVELKTEKHVSDSLVEAKIECLEKDKDAYLYYLLLRYTGRTLVFVNSIDSIRRLVPLLTTLGISAYPLHGQMQQQQRLRNLDRFKKRMTAPGTTPSAALTTVLLATDVAARGIDVQGIDHVVHYQIPRSADTYVHRSGRTARAGKSGVSVALISPGEQRLWRDIWRALERTDPVAPLQVEYAFLTPIRERLQLAREIDSLAHKQAKQAHDDTWLSSLAKEADIAVDSEDEDPDEAHSSKNKAARAAAARLAELRAELRDELARPLNARGVSHKYITSGTRRDFAQSMLAGNQSKTMLGVKHAPMQQATRRT
ncbi:RNA helicase [Malassezia cuniculi]|uniref:ATP-dependent RNA helicase n=1 Tax=Malassezia cuniculi TaxID=948313 RepID=A0AAF0EXC0_9BASI|nr:RNA helicase [Malassezia cuniculi]